MPTRMERYYNADASTRSGRSQRNAELYRSIYDSAEYSNIEGIASIEKNNEVDITKVKQMLQNRESYKQQRQVRQFVKEPEPIVEEESESFEDDERSYDIRDILNKAKTERSDLSKEHRNLKNTQYNILKSIKVNPANKPDGLEEQDREELRELIDTITNTSLLNRMGDQELSLNMFDDLKSTHNTMVGDPSSIHKLIDDQRKSTYMSEEVDDDAMEIDKSFYTSNLGFTDDDFEELKEVHSTLKKNNLFVKIIAYLVLIVVVTLCIYFAFQMMKHK